jgi:hypothetical protein
MSLRFKKLDGLCRLRIQIKEEYTWRRRKWGGTEVPERIGSATKGETLGP